MTKRDVVATGFNVVKIDGVLKWSEIDNISKMEIKELVFAKRFIAVSQRKQTPHE